jgi:shikimate dehydrogenase
MSRRILLGLIGSNILKSLSPALHEHALRAAGFSGHYHLMDIDVLMERDLRSLFSSVKATGFTGINVTFPFKEAIIPFLDQVSDDAKQIGAVNTVTIDPKGRTKGYNSDCSGFRRSFEHTLTKSAAEGKSVVLVGAGGAGRAVAFALMQLGAKSILVHDQDEPRARKLAENVVFHFGPRAEVLKQLNEQVAAADGLVNATPLGMQGFPGQPIPSELMQAHHWVADVVYTPIETELLRMAKNKGARTLDGAGMCVYQAVEAFRLFTGVTPDPREMHKEFSRALAARDRS